MNDNTKAKELGKIVYYDPNSTLNNNAGDNLDNIFNGINLVKPVEDLSIAIDFEIISTERNNVENKEKKLAFSSVAKKNDNNFIQGTNIGGSDTLTTFFTDISYDSENSNYSSEGLNIESIDVEFTSWYVASVIVKFVDVRGTALFSPSENYYSNKRNDIEESLFAGFFRMPYPMFNLRIKGFYGDAVTYPLHCQDFKAEFNSDKGNFNITVQFIGYTYALLSDIQLPYILAAPYLSEYGASYWDEQINKGRFLSFEGNPLPKITDLLKKIQSGENAVDKFRNSEIYNVVNSTRVKYDHMQTILNLVNDYIKLLSSKYIIITNEPYKLSVKSDKVNLMESLENDIESSNIVSNLNKMVFEYNNTFIDDTIFKKFEDIKYAKPKNVKSDSDNKNTGIIDLSELVNSIQVRMDANLFNQKKSVDELSSLELTSVIEIYQMVPSIYNFVKLLLAHMETLLYSIGACANNASKDNERKTTSGGEKTDLIGNKLLPFPWLTINENGKQVDEWIGNKYPNYSEVSLVKSFIKAKTDLIDNIQLFQTQEPVMESLVTDSTSAIGDLWFPINALDNSISTIGCKGRKPYSNLIKENGVSCSDLIDILSTRIATIVALSATEAEYKPYALAESLNIIKELGGSIESLNKVEAVLTDIITSNDLNRLLRKYLYTGYSKYIGYEYYLDGNKILPLNDEPSEVNRKNKLNEADDNFNYVSNNSGYTSNGVKIINNTNDCNIITNWFLAIKQTIGDYKDIENTFLNYKLERLESASCFTNEEYSEQPMFNRLGYKKPILDSYNTKTVGELYEYCGHTKEEDKYINKNFYKLYLGKTSKEEVKNKKTIKRSKIFIDEEKNTENLTYPLIGGYYQAYANTPSNQPYLSPGSSDLAITSRYFSLFGSEIYYRQNDHINDNTKRKAKAYLFLQSLPIDVDYIEKLFNTKNKSFMYRIPKASLLLIGSMLYRRENPNLLLGINKKDYFYNVDLSNYGYYLKDYKTKLFRLTNKPYYLKCKFIDMIKENTDLNNKLIKFFEDWVDANESLDCWKKIQSSFELRTKNDNGGFDYICERIKEDIKYLKEEIDEDVLKNYDSIKHNDRPSSLELINNDNSDGVKSIVKLLFEECIIAFSGEAVIVYDKENNKTRKTDISEVGVKTVVDYIKGEIKKQKDSLTNVKEKINLSNINSTMAVNNDEENLLVYKHLKTLYDKWVCSFSMDEKSDNNYRWIKSEVDNLSGFNTYDIKGFKFIDRAYNNIGHKFIINFKEILSVNIDANGQKSLYSLLSEIFSKNNFLFVPMPNYQSVKEAEDLANIFKPYPYNESSISLASEMKPLFVCLYVGTPSKSLDIKDSFYSFQNDSLNLSLDNSNDIPEDFSSENIINIDDENKDLSKVPVFAISYGKQNQSYFKKITLNQNNPATTFASIAALKNLNERNDRSSAMTTLSQDLYDVYSNYSYTCQVEMMGCAQIQPMMYFQLMNSPMWNGSYLIFKVNHSITPGSMTTSFTGMRMSNTYPRLVTPKPITVSDLSSSLIDISMEGGTSVISLEDKLGSFPLGDYCGKNKEVPVNILNRIYKNLKPVIESIYTSWNVSNLNKNYGTFIITSGYRTKEQNDKIGGSKTSAHLDGFAVDIQLANISKFKEANEALFEHIKQRMKNGLKIDQLILEHGNVGDLCHIGVASIENNVARVRGEVKKRDRDLNSYTYELLEVIPQAQSKDIIIDNFSPNIKWLNYWKTAENDKKNPNGGWREDEQLWYAHKSPEADKLDASDIDKAPTIAYGIKLWPAYILTEEIKANIELIVTGSRGITDAAAEYEILSKAEVALKDIKRFINNKYGSGSYENIDEKYKYAIVDIYLNTYYGSFKSERWRPFIEGALKNDINKMIENAERINNRRTELFKKYLTS